MLVHPSRRVRSSSTTRMRMVGFASGGMESASNAPRGARVSDIPEERGTRPHVTGSPRIRLARVSTTHGRAGAAGNVQLHRHTLWHVRFPAGTNVTLLDAGRKQR